MGIAVLVGGRSRDIQEFCFLAAKPSGMDYSELQSGLFAIVRNGIFRLRYVQRRAAPTCKRDDLLKLRNRVFRLRNLEIWAVLSSNEVDLLMLRNRVLRMRNVQKYAVPSRKGLIC